LMESSSIQSFSSKPITLTVDFKVVMPRLRAPSKTACRP
jgi:hypothetical protein